MSAAKCACMGPNPAAPPLSMGMMSRQFSQPPCPCIKCKDRARERHEAQIEAIAQSKSGICGQCVKGMLIVLKECVLEWVRVWDKEEDL
ncbi:hypothetical protein ACLKA7_006585 [Drosophila subpalustris]